MLRKSGRPGNQPVRPGEEIRMNRFMVEGDEVVVPSWVNDLESFRRWSDDDDFPETGQISFLCGEVWVDMSKEQPYTHGEVKSEINTVLRALVKATATGRYWEGGVYVSNEEGDVSNQPDGVYVSFKTQNKGLVQSIESKHEGHVELEGSPDMVLEVVSRSSVKKDTEVLREAYARAGIREYWLVDARKGPLRFDILRLSRGRYVAARKHAGWARSDVFDRWFRLRQEEGADGFPECHLDVRTEKPA
jgi:Uma2 family endonuclease